MLMRRYMMRIAERDRHRRGRAQALVTGESLGQVASQTHGSHWLRRTPWCIMPVFRPLIGLDKSGNHRAGCSDIGTYETSILPYEDCCTVFTPQPPEHAPPPRYAGRVPSRQLDTEALVREAVEATEVIKV